MTTLNPEQRDAVAILAYVYLRSNRLDSAEILLTALHALGDTNPKVLPSLAWAQLRQDKPVQALGTLDLLAMRGDSSRAFYLMRAEALTHLNRMDEARLAMQAYVQARSGPDAPIPDK